MTTCPEIRARHATKESCRAGSVAADLTIAANSVG
jgi:hypothetical protein